MVVEVLVELVWLVGFFLGFVEWVGCCWILVELPKGWVCAQLTLDNVREERFGSPSGHWRSSVTGFESKFRRGCRDWR